MFKTISFSKKALIFIVICFEASLVSCQDKITKIELLSKNPVEYVFNTTKDSLNNLIIKQLRINKMMLFDATHGDMVSDAASELFSQPNNKSDFCLMPLNYICKSKIYQKKNGDSLEYIAWFYLHLETSDEIKTKVSIRTIEPEVIIGRELFPSLPHFVRKDKTLPVEPSTIEEYEILLEIGKLVGEKDMPPIHLPTKK
jgi:hypothetical protein